MVDVKTFFEAFLSMSLISACFNLISACFSVETFPVKSKTSGLGTTPLMCQMIRISKL